MTQAVLVLVPLRVEAAVLRTAPGWRVLRTGMGAARSRKAAARGLAVDAAAVVVVGVCAAVSPDLRPGDIVCATELRREGTDAVETDGSDLLATAIGRQGLRAVAGPLVSTDHLTGPKGRGRLEHDGVLALDMESAWLAEAAGGRPFAVVRAVVEPAGRRLADPRTVPAGIRALASLRRACPAIAEWAADVASSRIPDEPVRELAAR